VGVGFPRTSEVSTEEEDMTRSRLATLAVLSLASAFSGCKALSRMEAPSLEGSPDTSGLVVVEPDITVLAAILGITSSASPVGGVLASVDGTMRTAHGESTSDYVVFSNVPPGRWQLVGIEADWQQGSSTIRKRYGMPPESADAFTFDVHAGEAVYLGARIDDDARFDTRGVRYSRREDPGAEREAWEWMDDIYEKTSWEPVFRAKLALPEVEAETASAPKGGD
jgi:hypothetical protein